MTNLIFRNANEIDFLRTRIQKNIENESEKLVCVKHTIEFNNQRINELRSFKSSVYKWFFGLWPLSINELYRTRENLHMRKISIENNLRRLNRLLEITHFTVAEIIVSDGDLNLIIE